MVPAQVQVVAALVHLLLPAHLLVPARLPVLRPVLAALQAVVALAHLAVVVLVEVAPQLTRSCSAAMAGISRSPGRPMCGPAPRLRRKQKRRP